MDFKNMLKYQILREIKNKKKSIIRWYWMASGSAVFCSIFGFFIWSQIMGPTSSPIVPVLPILPDATVSLAPEIVTVEKKAF
jgi:hypothetical protein